jgi:hypothetical protein
MESCADRIALYPPTTTHARRPPFLPASSPLLLRLFCSALSPSAGSLFARSPPRAGPPPPFRRLLRRLDSRPLVGRRRPPAPPMILAGKGLSLAKSFCSFPVPLSGGSRPHDRAVRGEMLRASVSCSSEFN